MAGICEAKATGGSPRRKLFGFHMSHKEEPAGGGPPAVVSEVRVPVLLPRVRQLAGAGGGHQNAHRRQKRARLQPRAAHRQRSPRAISLVAQAAFYAGLPRPNPPPRRAASLRRSGLGLRLPRAVRPHRRRHVGRSVAPRDPATWTSTSASRRRGSDSTSTRPGGPISTILAYFCWVDRVGYTFVWPFPTLCSASF
ncbi:hypothetical protein MUK42_24134 [Musa troglodytarum]|uniref:Uncharacterized protein n=1 Tax=Musa troglodytarum TaxID=320322 RepID=A0A9E7L878_9LILI|nr:hypothetical protein MUK42_24134 [Musa troglodytarum]